MPAYEWLTEFLLSAFPDGAALHEPTFSGNEWNYVKDCLDTGWVSSVGGYVDRFEEMLCDVTGREAAVATVNGTAAMHLLLVALGVRHGDEIIMPALTFVATANAAVHAGALPHFVDVETTTLGLDPGALEQRLHDIGEQRDGVLMNRETGARIRAVVGVDVFGHPCDAPALAKVADDFGITYLQDSAESLGSLRGSKPAAAGGLAAILSFNGNKTVTTGGGGAVVTDDEALAARLRHLGTTAKEPHRWAYRHDATGYNYRLPNINAALGCAQLEQLDRFVARKRRLAEWYRSAFAGPKHIQFVDEPPACESNFWLNAVLIPDAAERDAVLERANTARTQLRPAWEPMHRLPMFNNCARGELAVTEDICNRLVNLPSGIAAANLVLETQ